jgi:5-methylcytosine-specific restriction endonuclease McrA
MATTWTEGRRRAFITNALRAATRKWPPKYETLNEAKTEKKKNVRTGRLAQHYLCNVCTGEFPAKEVQVDHIQPVVDPKTGFIDWDTFIDRLFCEKENLQVLCTACHKVKTSKENLQSKLKKQLKPKKAPSSSKVRSRKKKPTT